MKKLFTALVLAVAAAAGGQAQAWPDRPVTLLVPFPPGGSTDLIGGQVDATFMNINPGINNTPDQFTAFQATEFARWKKDIDVGKITAD